MKHVDLAGLLVEADSGTPLVLLREHDAPHRVVPIVIGGVEAAAIALALSDDPPERVAEQPAIDGVVDLAIGTLGQERHDVGRRGRVARLAAGLEDLLDIVLAGVGAKPGPQHPHALAADAEPTVQIPTDETKPRKPRFLSMHRRSSRRPSGVRAVNHQPSSANQP